MSGLPVKRTWKASTFLRAHVVVICGQLADDAAAIAYGRALINQPLDRHVAKASPAKSPVIAIPDQWSARKRCSTLIHSSGLLQITVTGHQGLPLRRLGSAPLAKQFRCLPFVERRGEQARILVFGRAGALRRLRTMICGRKDGAVDLCQIFGPRRSTFYSHEVACWGAEAEVQETFQATRKCGSKST
jgi:hypothetical protein